MAICSELYNPVYEQVRQLGLPYEIKESGGSVVIKITADNKQNSFSKEKEKFRFNTKRTFNGSSNLNWRSPANYNEKSVNISEQKIPFSFPSLQFFQTTPPPQRSSQPPPTSRPTASCPSAATSPNQTPHIPLHNPPQFSSTPALNPYRIEKRTTFFPKTPNLLSPVVVSTSVSSSGVVSSISSSNSENPATVFNPNLNSSLECLPSQREPPDDYFDESRIVPPTNYEPLVQLMKAIYEGTAK